jgi:hypothetical protein
MIILTGNKQSRQSYRGSTTVVTMGSEKGEMKMNTEFLFGMMKVFWKQSYTTWRMEFIPLNGMVKNY